MAGFEQNLHGMTVLVTGGALRVGRQIVMAFASHGARVVVHCNRSLKAAEELLPQLQVSASGEHLAVSGDLTDEAFRKSLIPGLLSSSVALNCLVNNASVYRRRALIETDEASMAEDMGINFRVPFLMMRDFAEFCHEGCIINLLDQRVKTVDPGAGIYGIAKKALRDAGEAAALEWAPGIRVNAVAPGYTLPPPGVSEDAMKSLLPNVPLGRPSPPEDVAAACIYLASAKNVTGQTIYVDGGMHLTSPVRSERLNK